MGYYVDELKFVKSVYGKKFFMKIILWVLYCGEKVF